jgi:hypothetical protein
MRISGGEREKRPCAAGQGYPLEGSPQDAFLCFCKKEIQQMTLLKKLHEKIANYFSRKFANFVSYTMKIILSEYEKMRPSVKKESSAAQKVEINMKQLFTDLQSSNGKAFLQEFFTGNHRFVALLAEQNRRAAIERCAFVDANLGRAIFVPDQFRLLQSKREIIAASHGGGHILDLGVYKGNSTRALASLFPEHTVHGFDSFEGLSEDWSHAVKGTFGDVKGILPNVPDNVLLHKGWFEDTLPEWFAANKNYPISLLRVDCDIYSSTKTIFSVLHTLIIKGTWILFDELIGYRGWKNHEYKVFNEFINETEHDFEYVGFGLTYVLLYIK